MKIERRIKTGKLIGWTIRKSKHGWYDLYSSNGVSQTQGKHTLCEINERLAEIERQRLTEIENKKIRVENARLQKEAELKEAELQKERKLQADKEAKLLAENNAKLKAEQDAKAKIEAELQARKDAEIKAENERLAKIELDKKVAILAAKAPIKKQLSVWVESFELPIVAVDNETSKEIKAKFEAFKLWSINQINNL